MPIDYRNYPPNWKTEIRPAVLERAKNRCEWCNVPNYAVGYRDHGGHLRGWRTRCFKNYADAKLDADVQNESSVKHWIVIVLTVAHLDHNPSTTDLSQLRALCQRCHTTYDHNERARRRREQDPQLALAL